MLTTVLDSRSCCKLLKTPKSTNTSDICFRLATYLIRHADLDGIKVKEGMIEISHRAVEILKREQNIGRLGGGVPKAIEQWFIEGWLYIIILSIVIGIVVGYGSMYAIKFALNRKWIDAESFLLWPMAIGVSAAIPTLYEYRLTSLS